MWSTSCRWLSLCFCLWVLPLDAALKTGDAVPDLTEFGLEGTLPATLRGQVVLLDFWASWCAPCRLSFPVMDELRRQYADQGLVILAVNVDEDRADQEAFLKKVTVGFTVLRDAAHKLVAYADVAAMPTSFLVDRKGIVRFVHHGFHGAATRTQYQEEIQRLLKE